MRVDEQQTVHPYICKAVYFLTFYFVLEESHILFHAKSSDRVGCAYKFKESNKICQNQ